MPDSSTCKRRLRLGLIGDNIAASQAPGFHCLAGVQSGIDVTYDRLVPSRMEMDFDTLFAHCASSGLHGINVTYPYKERVVRHVDIPEPIVASIGAVNTVLFGPGRPRGYNTDHSGFIATYRSIRQSRRPGKVILVGTGGVGRAVSFGLLSLGAEEICLLDQDVGKATHLAADLQSAATDCRITVSQDAAVSARGADGFINCTPVGMVGYEGTPLPASLLRGGSWAFDAVYTPVETRFLSDAAAAGLEIISGYELFFNQAVDAWKLFAGAPLDSARMRQELAAGAANSDQIGRPT